MFPEDLLAVGVWTEGERLLPRGPIASCGAKRPPEVLAREFPADWEPVLDRTGKRWSIILRAVDAGELHGRVLFTEVDFDGMNWQLMQTVLIAFSFGFGCGCGVSITNFHEQFVNVLRARKTAGIVYESIKVNSMDVVVSKIKQKGRKAVSGRENN
jgi:hypothetical protein